MTDIKEKKSEIIKNYKNDYRSFIKLKKEDEPLYDELAKINYKIERKVNLNIADSLSCSQDVVHLAYLLNKITKEGNVKDMNKMNNKFSELDCDISSFSLLYDDFKKYQNSFLKQYNKYLQSIGNSLDGQESCCSIC